MESVKRNATVVNDTAAEADAVLLQCIRAMSPRERFRKSCAMSQSGRRFAMDAIRRRYPTADEREVCLRFVEIAYGPVLAADVRGWLAEHGR